MLSVPCFLLILALLPPSLAGSKHSHLLIVASISWSVARDVRRLGLTGAENNACTHGKKINFLYHRVVSLLDLNSTILSKLIPGLNDNILVFRSQVPLCLLLFTRRIDSFPFFFFYCVLNNQLFVTVEIWSIKITL